MNSWRETSLNLGILWLRVLMGFGIAFFHGYGKVFGGRIDRFTEGVAEMGFPVPIFFAWAAALTEFLGGLLIALGLGTRLVALLLFINMGVAAFIRHAADPFDVKELAFAYWVMAMAILLIGLGLFSFDHLIHKYLFKKN
ncbi:MAG TPA: DoxX family protein [Thermodesulfobacteriota bacterium]|nr:DoxX family protein [Thermodesulfobacteriota bacterium]